MLEQMEAQCPHCKSLSTVISDRSGKILHEDVCLHYQGVTETQGDPSFLWMKE